MLPSTPKPRVYDVSRRRRWWKLLTALDGSIELSEPMRVELLLELSGLTRQEIIVIKACAPDAKSSASVAATLVEQYSGVHLREGRRLEQPDLRKSEHLQTRGGKPSGYRAENGKGKTYIGLTLPMPRTMRRRIIRDYTLRRISTRRRTTMKPPTKLLKMRPRQGIIRTQKAMGKTMRTGVSESEAIALNCLEELEESSEAGHAIQLQLATYAAFQER